MSGFIDVKKDLNFFHTWTKKIWWPPKISENNLVAPQNFGKKFDGPPKFRKKIWWPPKNPLAPHPRLKVTTPLEEDSIRLYRHTHRHGLTINYIN